MNCTFVRERRPGDLTGFFPGLGLVTALEVAALAGLGLGRGLLAGFRAPGLGLGLGLAPRVTELTLRACLGDGFLGLFPADPDLCLRPVQNHRPQLELDRDRVGSIYHQT